MSPVMASYVPWLVLCTVLLYLRVAGQLIVAWRAPRWLPPMEQWQSGLLPYPVLVLGQIIVLCVMTWICLDFARGAGMFVQPYPGRAQYVLWFGYAYLSGMVLRYAIWMARRPDQRWLGGTIPIVFHSIVALFIITFATFHQQLGG
jgi:uncharacterized protein